MNDQYKASLGAVAAALPRQAAVWQKENFNGNPLDFLTPALESGFLPTRVCHLFFAVKPYDWTAAAVAACVTRIRLLFPLFPRFEIHIWLDFYVAAQIQAAGFNSTYVATLAATEPQVVSLCTANADIGFAYHGRVSAAGGPAADISGVLTAFFADA